MFSHLATRMQLKINGKHRHKVLADVGLCADGDTALFQIIAIAEASEIHEQLAQQGIFTRLFIDQPRIRFGLPGNESEWQRSVVAELSA